MVPRRRVSYRDSVLEEMDLPALLRRRPELSLIDELAHTNAPGRRAREALPGRRGRARGRDRRVLDRQRPAPREPQRPGRRADRHPRARDGPRRGPRRGRRGRPDRHHAAVADRAAASPARSIPPSASRPRSTTSSRSRTSPRCARSRCARSPRRSRPSASRSIGRRPPGRPGDERLIDTAGPAAVGERLLALVTPQPKSRSASCAGPGARPSGSAPSSTSCGSPITSPTEQEQEQLDALRRLSSVLGAHLLVEHGDDVAHGRAAGRPGPRHHLRPDGDAQAARRAPPPDPAGAAVPAAGAAARRRPADRGRPDAATERRLE